MLNRKELKFVKVNGEFHQIICDYNADLVLKIAVTKTVMEVMKKRGF